MTFSKDFAENSDTFFFKALGEASASIEKAAAINLMRLCSEEDRARMELMGSSGLASEHSEEIQQRMTAILTEAVQKMSAVLVDSYGITSIDADN